MSGTAFIANDLGEFFTQKNASKENGYIICDPNHGVNDDAPTPTFIELSIAIDLSPENGDDPYGNSDLAILILANLFKEFKFKALVLKDPEKTVEQTQYEGTIPSHVNYKNKGFVIYLDTQNINLDELKKLLLQAWKQLQIKGIKFSKTGPTYTDNPIPVSNHLISPFSYILPKGAKTNPLENFNFTEQDLEDEKISIPQVIQMLAERASEPTANPLPPSASLGQATKDEENNLNILEKLKNFLLELETNPDKIDQIDFLKRNNNANKLRALALRLPRIEDENLSPTKPVADLLINLNKFSKLSYCAAINREVDQIISNLRCLIADLEDKTSELSTLEQSVRKQLSRDEGTQNALKAFNTSDCRETFLSKSAELQLLRRKLMHGKQENQARSRDTATLQKRNKEISPAQRTTGNADFRISNDSITLEKLLSDLATKLNRSITRVSVTMAKITDEDISAIVRFINANEHIEAFTVIPANTQSMQCKDLSLETIKLNINKNIQKQNKAKEQQEQETAYKIFSEHFKPELNYQFFERDPTSITSIDKIPDMSGEALRHQNTFEKIFALLADKELPNHSGKVTLSDEKILNIDKKVKELFNQCITKWHEDHTEPSRKSIKEESAKKIADMIKTKILALHKKNLRDYF